jgi:hypothetical protein
MMVSMNPSVGLTSITKREDGKEVRLACVGMMPTPSRSGSPPAAGLA